MSSMTNIVAGRLGLAAVANLPGGPVASPADRRAPSSYGMTRLGIVPTAEDLAHLPMPLARPVLPDPPAGIGRVSPCGAGILPAQGDAGKMPAPQAEAPTTARSCADTVPPATPEPPTAGTTGTMAPTGTTARTAAALAEPAEPAMADESAIVGAATEPVPAEAQAQPLPQAPAGTADKRRTFRLPERLANCLKAYAATTGQYQYIVATEALRQFLDQAVPALDFARRARLAELQARLATDAAPSPPGPGTTQTPGS